MERPNTTAPSIWALTRSGFTASPQSIAVQARGTRTSPSGVTVTSRAAAVKLPKLEKAASPMPVRSGSERP